MILPESELEIAVNYFFNEPPRKQIIGSSNQLTFDDNVQRPIGKSDTEWISVLIRRVRNNLFHGGKFRYERPRDTDLIKNSLIILEAWSHCHPDVEDALRGIMNN